MNTMEEYCWATTQAAEQFCCGRSGSGVLDFEFQSNVHTVCTYCLLLATVAQSKNCPFGVNTTFDFKNVTTT